MKRKIPDYLGLIIKGMSMGVADVVPGVSGGTVALITGIYAELIASIQSINIHLIQHVRSHGIIAGWHKINGNFLLAVAGGIIISIFSLSKLMQFLLASFPILVWSFFFGLILVSGILLLGRLPLKKVSIWVMLAIGSGFAFWLAGLSPASTPNASWFIFLAGSIAICAMVLPGISGSFILLLLGKYQYIITAVSEFNLSILAVFFIGALTGLLSFVRLINWLLKSYHDITLALMVGFMLGGLNVIWPWKMELIKCSSELGENDSINVLPWEYLVRVGDPQLVMAIAFAMLGGLVILLLHFIGLRSSDHFSV